MKNISVLQAVGLPPEFGVLLLSFSFILLVAPYFAGLDFGVVKVPKFPQRLRRRLVVLGPMCFALAFAAHMPILQLHVESVGSAQPPQDGPQPVPNEPVRQNLPPPSKSESPTRDPLEDQLEKYLKELDQIEKNWDKEHSSVNPLAERVAVILKIRYPVAAAEITEKAHSSLRSAEVAAVVRAKIRTVLDQMSVERHE